MLEINRKYEFKICLKCPDEDYQQWAEDVINLINNRTLKVFDPCDETLFRDVACCNYDTVIEKAKDEIKISDYLPLACQCIRWIDICYDKELLPNNYTKLASYWSNINRSLFPKYPAHPLGPSAFIGEIVLYEKLRDEIRTRNAESENRFKYVIAHELVHVFNEMRIIVPAFRNWDNFWERPLQNGNCCQKARDMKNRLNNYIDSYGTDVELSELKKYWPVSAETWFNSMRNTR
jgi:hypothetical protein